MNKLLSSIFNLVRATPKPTVQTVQEKASGFVRGLRPAADSFACPYCLSKNFVRRGFRQKKMEKVQLYLCADCHKTFTAHVTKGKHYPLPIMFDAISIYNLGYSLEETCRIVNHRDTLSKDLTISATTLSNWLSETGELCRFERMQIGRAHV